MIDRFLCVRLRSTQTDDQSPEEQRLALQDHTQQYESIIRFFLRIGQTALKELKTPEALQSLKSIQQLIGFIEQRPTRVEDSSPAHQIDDTYTTWKKDKKRMRKALLEYFKSTVDFFRFTEAPQEEEGDTPLVRPVELTGDPKTLLSRFVEDLLKRSPGVVEEVQSQEFQKIDQKIRAETAKFLAFMPSDGQPHETEKSTSAIRKAIEDAFAKIRSMEISQHSANTPTMYNWDMLHQFSSLLKDPSTPDTANITEQETKMTAYYTAAVTLLDAFISFAQSQCLKAKKVLISETIREQIDLLNAQDQILRERMENRKAILPQHPTPYDWIQSSLSTQMEFEIACLEGLIYAKSKEAPDMKKAWE